MLALKSISKQYDGFALKKISFSVEKGDYFILLGESGAGKSLVLETIAGLILPDSGSIVLNGRDITRTRIPSRGVGLVFQDYAIFPHLTVRANLEYPLHRSKLTHAAKKDQTQKIAEQAGIGNLLGRRPSTLSGGELQRVALARTLIQSPEILLLDEPLASLDSQLRSELRNLLRGLNRTGQTIIHVTHDFEEAISLASRIAVIHKGEILQSGTPEEVFLHPRSEFVAHFVGVKNFFRVTLERENGKILATGQTGIRIGIAYQGNSIHGFLLLRGEDILVSNERPDTSAINNFSGKILDLVPHRGGYEVSADIGMILYAIVTTGSVKHLGLFPGKNIWISFKANAVRFIPA
ncbi:MAG TPA: ABC transporter ATP-binding protein [Bacteroidales bacterium]|nr:ABC transporter ATP-binding protein [Bacteroidales bacterium]